MYADKGLAAAMFYMVLSPSMAFINKVLLTSYEFNFPFTIMACQMLVTIVALEFLRLSRIISLSSYSFHKGYSFFWPSVFYAATSVTSLMALNGMNIPMYGTIKRCGPLVTLILSITLLRKPFPSSIIVSSVLLITFGALVAGIGDMSTGSTAYICGSISVLSQALYLTLTQKSAESNVSSVQILQLNSFNTLPVFVISLVMANEPYWIPKHHSVNRMDFYLIFTLVVTCGALMNYSLFLCTALNCALTTSLVGVMKSVIQTAIGFFTFGGVKVLPINFTGIILNLIGGCLYTYGKYRDKVLKDRIIIPESNVEFNSNLVGVRVESGV
ncbi:SLC35D3 (predicted) [Pycnogonum litorale]